MYSTDRELIAAMLAGDEAAFRSFFTAYFPRVYRFALPRLSGEAEAAKEVVQATLTKAMRNLAGYRGEAALCSAGCARFAGGRSSTTCARTGVIRRT